MQTLYSTSLLIRSSYMPLRGPLPVTTISTGGYSFSPMMRSSSSRSPSSNTPKSSSSVQLVELTNKAGRSARNFPSLVVNNVVPGGEALTLASPSNLRRALAKSFSSRVKRAWRSWMVVWRKKSGALSYKTTGSAPQCLTIHSRIDLVTQKCASATREKKRSYKREANTKRCLPPRPKLNTVKPKLCQSTTIRAPYTLAAIHTRTSEGMLGGFCTRIASGRGIWKKSTWVKRHTSTATLIGAISRKPFFEY
mmetsp:Transcript_17211/g.49786  ORF Transcript_17211/g.49786 Transcript_17211/m.49786 type:complete len:251 (+) Transcript_17211:539-1291(+)